MFDHYDLVSGKVQSLSIISRESINKIAFVLVSNFKFHANRISHAQYDKTVHAHGQMTTLYFPPCRCTIHPGCSLSKQTV